MTSTTITRLWDSAVGVQPVDSLGCDRDRRVEAKRVVGAGEVVVDRLRDSDDRKVVLAVKSRGNAERVLAPDRHESVEAGLGEVAKDGLDPPSTLYGLVRVVPRRAAARQDARDLATAERREDPFGQAFPAVTHPHHLVPAVGRAPDDRTDHRIEARTVTAAGQDPDPHARWS